MSSTTLSQLNSLIVEYVKEPKTAQKILEAVEAILKETETKVDTVLKEKIEDKTKQNQIIIKGELKDELKTELVTRELFEERFNVIDEKFIALRTEINERFNVVDERFKLMEVWFKVMIAVMIFGFFIFNPGFLEVIKEIFGLF
jgi:hypothetical protein